MQKPGPADYFYVGIQIFLFVFYWWMPLPVQPTLSIISSISGLVCCGIGAILIVAAFLQLNKNLTMFPTPSSGAKLITSGVFKFIRHPIYTGIFLFAAGWAMYSESFNKLLIAMLILLLFEIKSNYEERKLMEHFLDYESYRKQTGKFFPFYIKQIKNTNGTTS